MKGVWVLLAATQLDGDSGAMPVGICLAEGMHSRLPVNTVFPRPQLTAVSAPCHCPSPASSSSRLQIAVHDLRPSHQRWRGVAHERVPDARAGALFRGDLLPSFGARSMHIMHICVWEGWECSSAEGAAGTAASGSCGHVLPLNAVFPQSDTAASSATLAAVLLAV